MITLTAKQAKLLGLQSKKEKYHRVKKSLDGITFDSTKERDYYAKLLLLKKAGEVVNIELQPKFELQPAFERYGKKERAITYKADFKVSYADGHIEIVEVKGYRQRDYLLRRKMLLYRYPNIIFREV